MRGLGWMGLASLAAAAAAGVAILGRVGLQNVDTVLATMLRSMVMALAVIAVATTTGRFGDLLTGRAVINARAWGFVVAAGICGAVSWLAYFAALRLGPAGPVAALGPVTAGAGTVRVKNAVKLSFSVYAHLIQ